MFCVIIKVNAYAGDDVKILGPYATKVKARKAQRTMKSNLVASGVNVESISTEVKEMVKY